MKNTAFLCDVFRLHLFGDTGWRCHPDSNWGVELLQSSALPLGYGTVPIILCSFSKEKNAIFWKHGAKKLCPVSGASDEARTRYLHLGKVALYQMSYTRIWVLRRISCGGWCLRSESNQRHEDFQSSALPTELQRQTYFSSAPKERRKNGDAEGT